MTDEAKMPDEIYAIKNANQSVPEIWSAENIWTNSTRYVRADKATDAGDICDSDISTIRKSIGSNYLNNKQLEEIEDAHMALNRVEAALTPPDNADLVKVRDFVEGVIGYWTTSNDCLPSEQRAEDILAILDSMMKREG